MIANMKPEEMYLPLTQVLTPGKAA
jgi:hypothetical protein